MSNSDLMTEARRCLEDAPINLSSLQPLDLADFLSKEFPVRENWLDPILPKAGLLMIYAPRGIGKASALGRPIRMSAAGRHRWAIWPAALFILASTGCGERVC